jgi:hypothetical protein
MAERGGFEPPVRFYPYNGLANRPFRPLRHLSVFRGLSQPFSKGQRKAVIRPQTNGIGDAAQAGGFAPSSGFFSGERSETPSSKSEIIWASSALCEYLTT